MNIQIKCRFSGSILFEHDVEDNTIKLTVEAAVKIDASLDGASLDGARLDRARLDGARLDRASLVDASLVDARLDRASLDRASLDGASLDRASLVDASLVDARLDRARLDGERPIFQLGLIGSRCDYFVAYITDKGLRFDAGCKRQIDRETFEKLLADTHGDNLHAQEYRAALAMVDAHVAIWTPREVE